MSRSFSHLVGGLCRLADGGLEEWLCDLVFAKQRLRGVESFCFKQFSIWVAHLGLHVLSMVLFMLFFNGF